MEHASDAVTDKVGLYAQSLLLDVSLDRVANDSDGPVGQRGLDADLKTRCEQVKLALWDRTMRAFSLTSRSLAVSGVASPTM